MSEQLPTAHDWVWAMLIGSALIATPLAILATAGIASLFRARVQRSMLAVGSRAESFVLAAPVSAAPGSPALALSHISEEDVLEKAAAVFRIDRAVFQLRVIYACAALAFAAVASFVYLAASDISLNAYRLAFAMLIFATPLPLALMLLESRRPRALLVAAIVSCTLMVLSASPFLAPQVVLEIWLLWTGVPTAIAVLFAARRLRAGGPLVFAAAWMLVAAFFVGLGLAGPRAIEDLGFHFVRPDLAGLPLTDAGLRVVDELAVRVKDEGLAALGAMLSDRSLAMVQHPQRVTLGYVVLFHVLLFAPVALAAALAWGLFAWYSRRYRTRRSSDVMLRIDTLFLTYAMSLVLLTLTAHRGWMNASLFVLPLLAYKATTTVGLRMTRSDRSPALTLLLLRVFGYEQRTQSFLDQLAARWRHVGPIRLIAGTDSAYASLEPHEFYDFLGGRLSRQFITGVVDLEQRLTADRVAPDPDGRYRIEDFYCHRDTWQMTVARLLRESDAILMDLRGFSEANQGCIFELGELVRAAPLSRTLLLVDGTTDLRLLEATTRTAWAALALDSPNAAEGTPTILLFHAKGSTARIARSLLPALLTRAATRGFAPADARVHAPF